MKIAVILLCVIAVYLVAVVVVNRTASFPAQTGISLSDMAAVNDTPEVISVSTWNLGYAGLGRESDFKIDGGDNLFAPSRDVVSKNIREITEMAASLGTDIRFFQEVAYSGPLTLGKPLGADLERALSPRVFWFRPDIATKLVPWPLRLRHGTAISTDMDVASGALIPIVGEAEPLFGVVRRQYGLQVLRVPGQGGTEWAFINIHLSAFDDGGRLRRAQINAVFDYAQALFQSGTHVVIGGDWNMELVETSFPHQTKPEDLFWIHRFPAELIPEGWSIAIDPKTPTVRTVNQPFVRGENYLTIIDGFIVSPNVDTVSVETIDTDFEMSDHMPVVAEFRARSE